MNDDNTLCPECHLACTISLAVHNQEHHINQQAVTFHDGHSLILQRDEDQKVFFCPRCLHPELRTRSIQFHCAECTAPVDTAMPSPHPTPPSEHDTPPAPPPSPGLDDLDLPPPNAPHPEPAYSDPTILYPGADTITSHATYLLPNYSVVINLYHRLLICIACQTALSPSSAYQHLCTAHDTLTKPPPGMVLALTQEYALRDPDDRITLPHPTNRPPPAFGLRVSQKPYIECGKCAHAYSSQHGITSHACHGGLHPPRSNTKGYAQQFSAGARNSWFLVDLEQRTLAPDVDFSSLASQLDLGVPDYNSEHLAPTLADSKKDILIARESWDEVMRKVPPPNARELTRLSTSEDELHNLGPPVVAYVARLQGQLRKYSTYGQQRDLADYGVQSHSLNTFNTITLESCKRYGRTLWSLIFNLLRQVDDSSAYKPTHLYPITTEQRAALLHLLHSFRGHPNNNTPTEDYADTQREMDDDEDIELFDLDEPPSENDPQATSDDLLSSALDQAIQRVVLALFRHEQTGQTHEKFFSPVLLFLVLSSIKSDGALILANSITQRIAHLTYCGRGSFMLEIERLLAEHPDWNFHQAHGVLKKYHTNGYVTPLVAIFQLFTLLKIIAQTEVAPCDGRWADLNREVVDWKGTLIPRDKLRRPYDHLIQEIETIYRRDVFFNKTIPFELSQDFFRDRDITDPAMNRAVGFCALDHPPNGFRELGHNYLRWLLSQPDLRHTFVYYAEGQIHWRPTPVKRLMDALDTLGLKIALAHDLAAPSLSRAQEIANMSLRNTPGSTTRNFQVILNTVALVSILDKTSHKRLNYRLIPSAPPTLLSRYILQLLVFIRPAQVFFARRFFGIDAAHRFHTALWPRVNGTLTGGMLSKHLAQLTHTYFGVYLRITPLRKFVSFWLKEHISPALQNTHAIIDRMASHSPQTALQHYDQDSGLAAGISANDVHLMLLVCRDWQTFIGVDRREPLALSIHGETIDEQGPLAEQYRALVNHYDVPDTDPPASTIPSPTIDVLRGDLPKELGTMIHAVRNELITNRTTLHAFRNELITDVASTIRDEMIIQQAILHPTLPPVHSFHELRDVSNVYAIFFEKLATNKTNLLAILRCGLGKTWMTLAALRILAPTQQLIWLIPTSGLQADTVLTAKNLGLSIARYKPGAAFNTEADLVWAPIEIIAREDFQTWVKQRVNAGRVWWVVLDEIHKFLTDIGYRPIFTHLISLARFGARFLGLSGTAPPPLLPILFALSGITTWDILRMPISRSNIALRAKRHTTHALARAALIADVENVLPTLGDEDRIMIFCRKRDMATEMAAVFNTDAYLAPGQDDPAQAELNEKLLPAWRAGLNSRNQPCKVSVSTSILGTGLNYAHVRHVFMLERPATLFDYQQQVERAGRDNQHAESTLYTSEQDSRRIPSSATDITLGVRELDELAKSEDTCRRSIPSVYFDGVLTTCMITTKTTSEPTAFCDYCERMSTEIPPSNPVPIITIDTRLIIGRQDPVQRLLPFDVTPRENNKSAASSSNVHARAAPPPKVPRRALPPPKAAPAVPQQPAPAQEAPQPLPPLHVAPPRRALPPPKAAPAVPQQPTPAQEAPQPLPPLHVAPPRRALPAPAQATNAAPTFAAAAPAPLPPQRTHPHPQRASARAQLAPPSQSLAAPQAATPAHASAPPPAFTEAVASRPPSFIRNGRAHPLAMPTHNDLIVQHGATFLPRLRAQGNVWQTRRDILARVWAPAVDKIRGKCPFCWVLGQLDDAHADRDCTVLPLEETDKLWKKWAKVDGLCWNCSVPHRVDGWHPDCKPADCRDAHILLPAVYAYLLHPPPDLPLTAATFLPRTVFTNGTLDAPAFSRWAHQRVPDHGPMLNLHVLSLWLLVRRSALVLPPELRSVFPVNSLP
ncbi:hypothetical protein B0H11DRAFT_2249451 [Mycena galericulata]|nr:hypothetical protein B0H11DRAFT_2249451 [Mycena galericulata]